MLTLYACCDSVRHPILNSILISTTQKGNPVLNHIKNVATEWAEIVPDYQVGATTCVLFLSIRYHRLHPEYIHSRIAKLGQAYHLRVLLVLCDVQENHQEPIKELTKVGLINNLTVMVCWSNEEAARYIELYKSFERKGPELIQERVDNDYMSQLTACLTSVKGINKTDVITLISNFGSLERIIRASADELQACPGLGEKKVKRLRQAFITSFKVSAEQKRKSAAQVRSESGDQSLN